jgi:hypothetical protein
MSLEIAYYDGSWIDITGVTRTVRVEDFGISKVPSATVVVHSDYATLATLRAAQYKQIRVLLDSTRVFLGRIWEINGTCEPATTSKQSLTLDCRHLAQRLADDTITTDYYALASATSPDIVWSYETMMNDFLTTPDSGYDTGFEINTPTGGNIDNSIDSSCVFERQSLLDGLRTVCDKIGYDGWFEYNDATSTPTVYIKPFAYDPSVATFTHPFKGEPSWSTGSLDDVFNYILVHGGNDSGIPADADRWTERAYAKYSPKIWSGGATSGSYGIADVLNTLFTYGGTDYGTNDYCVRIECPDITTNSKLWLILNPSANTGSGATTIDCKNRITSINLSLCGLFLGSSSIPVTFKFWFYLTDNSDRQIEYFYWNHPLYEEQPAQISLPVGTNQTIYASNEYGDRWAGNQAFDWEHVKKLKIHCTIGAGVVSGNLIWGFDVDGLQFVGGQPIDPFARYAPTYNPPVKDDASINTYGVHPLHLQDTALDSFEIAQKEGQRVLANLKSPVPTFTFTVPFTTIVRPSNVITVTCLQFGLNSTQMRALKGQYDWNSKNKRVFQTISCTSKLNSLPPLWTSQQELRPLVK